MNKNVLVFGLGISGTSTTKALHKLGANIFVADSKEEEDLLDFFADTKDIPMTKFLGNSKIDLECIDIIVKSPGIKPNNPIIEEGEERNIRIVSDIELAYDISKSPRFVAITGTNGKTTTSYLVGDILKEAKENVHLGGNIGIGILWDLVNSKPNDYFVIEASSFQLEHTSSFKPKLSIITNLSPDHLDWHGTMDKYIEAKLKVLINQDESDFAVLNYEDEYLRSIGPKVKSKIVWFSSKRILEEGAYIEEGNIVYKNEKEKSLIIPLNQLQILGIHNAENALAALAAGICLKVDLETIRRALREFKGVAHRIEFVRELRGVKYYNDSKGTNSDSTIKAINSFENPLILIAGGYDKGTDFTDLLDSFNGRVKALILLGATREKIRDASLKAGFKNLTLVEDMKEAVAYSNKIGQPGDIVLLSPACASWGMYKNFEERGNDFKALVNSIGE